MDNPLWLMSYDICCAKRLRKVYKLCCTQGWALQKSVFVFSLSKAQRIALCEQLEQLIDSSQDRLLCIPFSTPDGSFHHGNKDNWLLLHSDQRIDGFVF